MAKKLQFIDGEPTLDAELEHKASRTYHVQVLHNCSSDRRFNRWTSSLYNHIFFDRRAKKRLHLSRPDLFQHLTGRKETLVFEGTEDGRITALKLCAKLNRGCGWAAHGEYGRMLDKEEDKNDRIGPIRARVIEVNEVMTKELVVE